MEEVVKTARERYADKWSEMREKYADVINDLAIKEDKDVGVAFEMLKAIPRAILNGDEPMYKTEIEFDMEELIKDYTELLGLSTACGE